MSNVFGSWIWNGFIFGPVLSALVAYDDQDMIDEACSKVATDIGTQSYYSRSWMAISTMTLNGAVAKAGELFRTDTPPVSTSATTVGTTSATTQETTVQTTTAAPQTTSTTTTVATVSIVNSLILRHMIFYHSFQLTFSFAILFGRMIRPRLRQLKLISAQMLFVALWISAMRLEPATAPPGHAATLSRPTALAVMTEFCPQGMISALMEYAAERTIV